MKSFKQLFAVIFTLAVVAFGVLVMIDERDLFSQMSNLSFEGWPAARITISYILIIVVDVLLIALPALGFVLVLTGKYDPFKAIVTCGLIVLMKFLVSIIAVIIIVSTLAEAFGGTFDVKELFFGKESMMIIPTVVFGVALLSLLLAKASNLEGSIARAVLATLGSGLAIFGLVYYFLLGGGAGGYVSGNSDSNWLSILGLSIGIACFGGIVVYCFLPQTRDFKKAE